MGWIKKFFKFEENGATFSKEIIAGLTTFFTIIIMVVTYSITNGIAIGFVVYILTKLVVGKYKEIHPIIWGSSLIFVVYFVLMALKAATIL